MTLATEAEDRAAIAAADLVLSGKTSSYVKAAGYLASAAKDMALRITGLRMQVRVWRTRALTAQAALRRVDVVGHDPPRVVTVEMLRAMIDELDMSLAMGAAMGAECLYEKCGIKVLEKAMAAAR